MVSAYSARLTLTGQHLVLGTSSFSRRCAECVSSIRLTSEYGAPALDQWRRDWFFGSPAKGRPSIKTGDLVVAQTRDCYAVVEVTSEADSCLMITVRKGVTKPIVGHGLAGPCRVVPDELLELKAHELVRSTVGLQNGHIRLRFDQFTNAVRSLARLVTDSGRHLSGCCVGPRSPLVIPSR
jgi:hypothetical protein